MEREFGRKSRKKKEEEVGEPAERSQGVVNFEKSGDM